MQLGPYHLVSRLGAGGMGEVWRAEDTRLLRPAAIKILSDKIAADSDWKARFLREARMAAQLNHPNIATIYAVDEEGSTMYIAMELVEGTPLSALIAGRSLSHNDIVRIAAQTAEALAAAHAKSVVHRDIKPDNILVLPRGMKVKVLDFGIAKTIGAQADDSLTKGQLILGTPYYMSPEQALGSKIDFRTDIYSLGVVMYEALTGRRPFQGGSVTETVVLLLTKEPPDIAEIAPQVPSEIAAVVKRCIQKQPDQRYTAEELAEALEGLVQRPGRPTREQTIPTVVLGPGSFATPAGTPIPAAPTPVVVPPVAEAPKPAPPPKPAIDAEAAKAIGRALVTDDDAVTRELLADLLRRNGLQVDLATNGAEAIRQLKQQNYGIVFLDLLMPRIDGWEVLDFVRSKFRDGQMQIYILTGIREQRLSAADQEIVAGVINKPVKDEEIKKALVKTAQSRART